MCNSNFLLPKPLFYCAPLILGLYNIPVNCIFTNFQAFTQGLGKYEQHSERKHDENEEVTKTINDFLVFMEDGKKWSFDAVNHAVTVFESAFI